MTQQQERDYVLGTHDEEIRRLALQHEIWRPRVLKAWKRAGFGPGQTIVDVGCGPGHATLDLAQIVGPKGRAIGIERSRRFLDYLEAAIRENGLSNIEAVETDLDEQLSLPPCQVEDSLRRVEEPPWRWEIKGGADGAWCRWVLCFVKRPRDVLTEIVRMLRPGGVLVLHEYFDYSTWRMAPRCPELEEFVSAVMQSWRSQGGEPDISLSLPKWLGELGMTITSLRPIVEVAGPKDAIWQWPRSFIEVGLRRLVDLGFLTAERAAQIMDAVAAAESAPHTLMFTPALLEIIAARV